MNRERDLNAYPDEIELRDYLVVLLNKWWVVVAVFAIAVAIGILLAVRASDAYQVRTKLLIGPGIPAEALSALGTASNVLDQMIAELDLRDQITGRQWSFERLATMIESDLQRIGEQRDSITSGGGPGNNGQGVDGEGPSHILTMVFQGGEPERLKPIADKWVDVFEGQAATLITERVSRSYRLSLTRYEVAVDSLSVKEDEKLKYRLANPLISLRSRLNELKSISSDLVSAEARLRSVEEALGAESEFVTLEQGINAESILTLLINQPTREAADGLTEVVTTAQQNNSFYLSLKSQKASLESSIAALNADMAHLGVTPSELDDAIEELSNRIIEVETELARINREISFRDESARRLARQLQNSEESGDYQSQLIQVLEPPIEPQSPVPQRGRRQTLLVAGVLGLVLGVLAAFGVHYVREPRAERREEPAD